MLSSNIIVSSVLVAIASAQIYPNQSSNNHTCVIQPRISSCPPASPALVDSCCTETFGGLVLQTQFWQTWTGLESKGQKIPRDTWTIHGLWPDYCNGSYTQYCDLNRQYDPLPSPNVTNFPRNGTVVPKWTGVNITSMLTKFARYDLLRYMNTNWVNQGNTNDIFWAHEFAKHATCFSTFDVPCYGPQYQQYQEVIQFFETVIMFYQRYPTWHWLSASGITPSNSTRTSYTSIRDVLTKSSKAKPYVGCSGPRYNETDAGKGSLDNGRTVLSEVWYYNYVLGRPQEGISTPVNATGSGTNCAQTSGAVWYYEPTSTSLF